MRLYFVIQERLRRDPVAVERLLRCAETGDLQGACEIGKKSRGYVARALTHALDHRDISFSNALLHASSVELQRFNRGISVLDTIVTLAPLLGLLGTVTVDVQVSAAGLPVSVGLASSSGFSPLDQAALAAVRRWRFEPARNAGVAVAGRVRVPVRFQLSR